MDHTIRAFDDLMHQGKILYGALSTYPTWQLTEAVLLARQYGCYSSMLICSLSLRERVGVRSHAAPGTSPSP